MRFAKINAVKKSRKDIYSRKKNGEEEILIAKGEPYYWYKFKYQPKVICKEYPTEVDKYPDTISKQWQAIETKVSESIDLGEFDEDLYNELGEFIEERESAISNMEEYFSESGQLDSMREMLEEAENLYDEFGELE